MVYPQIRKIGARSQTALVEFVAGMSGLDVIDADDRILFHQRILFAPECADGGRELHPSESGA
jgi:hypothetical protein